MEGGKGRCTQSLKRLRSSTEEVATSASGAAAGTAIAEAKARRETVP